MPVFDPLLETTRRHFFERCGLGLGSMALGSLLGQGRASASDANPLQPRPGHFPAKAKSVIYLFMAGVWRVTFSTPPQAAQPDTANFFFCVEG